MSCFTAKTTYEDILTFKKIDIVNFLREHRQPISGNKAVIAQRACDYIALNFAATRSVSENENDIEGNDTITNETPNINELNFGWSSDLKSVPALTHNDVESCLISSSHRTQDLEKMNCYRQFIRGFNFFKEGYIHKMMINEIDNESDVCYVRSKCFPSMKKDLVYWQWVLLSKKQPVKIVKASCSCPAG